MNPLGTLESVNIRDVWQGEASHFTPWLAQPENLERLGEALAMALEPVSQETRVGSFFADLVCSNQNGETVLVENQLERTDHKHLGQIFTYAAGLDAITIVWISPQFTEEHQAAIDWLNRITLDNFAFFAVEVELWRIGDSPPAPKFNVVAKPNDWTRAMRRKRPDSGSGTNSSQSSELGLLQMKFWEGLKDHLANHNSPIRCQRPGTRGWMWHSIGRTGIVQGSIINSPNYGGSELPEIRAEFHITEDLDGSRLEKLRHLQPRIAEATGQVVEFEPNLNTANRSKFFVKTAIDWTSEEGAEKAYRWLDEKHRAILGEVREFMPSI